VWAYGECKRLSPEAPVPVMKYRETQSALGMAANVNENLKSLGINVNFLTNKETITKTRYVDEKSNYQVMRLDNEPDVKPLREAELRMAAMHLDYDAVVISDYDKGYVDDNLIDIIAPRNPGIKIFVDTKKKKLPTQYNNVVYKINKKEFELLDPDHIPNGKNMIVTHGANGALWDHQTFPVPITRVFDVTGAGDTFLAALVFYYIQLPDMKESINFANRCAAIAVQNPGTYTLTMEDVDGILGK
tara:strand:- start:1483 stop:2217 length:735 start_codon:yes stop_codon:yes gene_type:complete